MRIFRIASVLLLAASAAGCAAQSPLGDMLGNPPMAGNVKVFGRQVASWNLAVTPAKTALPQDQCLGNYVGYPPPTSPRPSQVCPDLQYGPLNRLITHSGKK